MRWMAVARRTLSSLRHWHVQWWNAFRRMPRSPSLKGDGWCLHMFRPNEEPLPNGWEKVAARWTPDPCRAADTLRRALPDGVCAVSAVVTATASLSILTLVGRRGRGQ